MNLSRRGEEQRRGLAMKLKWLVPTIGALAIIGTLSVPAEAQRRSPLRPDYDRRDYQRNDRWDYQRNDRRYGVSNARERNMAQRANAIERRARDLYRSGRLSRDHLERTLDKLNRVQYDADRRGVLSRDRVQANMRYLNQVENTLNEWSRADSRGGRYRPRR